jgi:uncharacterized membrane protein AbrB (regulator of aidB expression)
MSVRQLPQWMKFLIVCLICLLIAGTIGWLFHHFSQQ